MSNSQVWLYFAYLAIFLGLVIFSRHKRAALALVVLYGVLYIWNREHSFMQLWVAKND